MTDIIDKNVTERFNELTEQGHDVDSIFEIVRGEALTEAPDGTRSPFYGTTRSRLASTQSNIQGEIYLTIELD